MTSIINRKSERARERERNYILFIIGLSTPKFYRRGYGHISKRFRYKKEYITLTWESS